jgi:Tol biopolymer transport system component
MRHPSRRWLALLSAALAIGAVALAVALAADPRPLPRSVPLDPREKHFASLTMLTDGGENAEAYFSFAGDSLVFQSTHPPYGCDQIFTMKTDGSGKKLVSTGKGRTTCAYYMPKDRKILYASTHLGGPDCPPPADLSQGYVWPIYPDYDLFVADHDGSNVVALTKTPGYDAEATVSPKGDRIVFTSTRDGDLDIYTMKTDGSDVKRLTDAVGYDGGAFFSPDGTKIVYRAHHPEPGPALDDYRRLLAQNMIRPAKLEIWVMDADGRNKRKVTSLGSAAFAPFFHASGKKIVFSTNYPEPKGREFDLYLVDLDGKNLERITFGEGFDGFPMWSPDGRKFVFCSNRGNSKPGETNVFIAEWKD